MKISNLFNFHGKAPMIPKKYSTDLDIYDANGYIDDKKVAILDENKIEFAYEHAIGYMGEINKSIEIINTRTTLLLSYLLTAFAFLVVFLFQQEFAFDDKLEFFALLLIIAYFAIIFIIAHFLLSPVLPATIHNQPKNIMKQSMFQHDMKIIKIYEIELMQNRIKPNFDKHRKLAKRLKNCILATFFAPVFSSIGFYLF